MISCKLCHSVACADGMQHAFQAFSGESGLVKKTIRATKKKDLSSYLLVLSLHIFSNVFSVLLLTENFFQLG